MNVSSSGKSQRKVTWKMMESKCRRKFDVTQGEIGY
jgi:hypothetical protein